MRDDPSIAALAARVGEGDQREAALPGWLATTTTRHEALRVLRASRRRGHAGLLSEDQLPPDPDDATIEQEIIAAENSAALRAAFAVLPRRCHELLSLLASDPSGYAYSSTTLGLPVGSIGSTRARCLDRPRRSSHLTGVLGDVAQDVEVSPAGR